MPSESAKTVLFDERSLFHRVVGADEKRDGFRLDGSLFTVDDVAVPAVPFDDRFEVLVDVVDAARGVHPAGVLVESLVDEELTPCRCTSRRSSLRHSSYGVPSGRRTTCAD